MTRPPTIPGPAIDAAARDLHDCETLLSAEHSVHLARSMLTAALPALFPGLYVDRHDGLTVWRENPDHPERPTALTPLELLQTLAGLLPDRTDEAPEDWAMAHPLTLAEVRAVLLDISASIRGQLGYESNDRQAIAEEAERRIDVLLAAMED